MQHARPQRPSLAQVEATRSRKVIGSYQPTSTVVADGLSLKHGAQLAIDTFTRLCTATEASGGGLQTRTVLHWRSTNPELAGEGSGTVGCFVSRSGLTLIEKTATCVAALAEALSESSPFILQGRVKAALIRRWSAMLACSAARGFAVSFFARPPASARHRGSRLCTRSCGMHVSTSLLVWLP